MTANYRQALELAAAADHAQELAHLARAAIPRIEEKLQRLRAAVTATEESLTDARRGAADAEQSAERAAANAAKAVSRRGHPPAVETAVVTPETAGSAGTASQEG